MLEDTFLEDIHFAYQYALPLYEVYRLRYELQFDPTHKVHLPNNFLYHRRQLASPDTRIITTPNAEMLFSIAILDLGGGPVRIQVPDPQDRYYSIALLDAYTNNFEYISSRKPKTNAGRYWIAGPQAKNVGRFGAAVFQAPTPIVVLLLRILVDDPTEIDAARRLQSRFELMPFSRAVPRPPPIAPIPEVGANFVAIVNQAMAENPPPARDEPVLCRLGRAGIGLLAVPLEGEPRRAWENRFVDVRKALVETAEIDGQGSKGVANVVDGWLYPAATMGNFGTDYRRRAETAITALFAQRREENMSLFAVADQSGAAIDCRCHYRLRLPEYMPVARSWSLSIYQVEPDGRCYLAANPLNRYSINEATPDLEWNEDGSLDVLIQRDPPEPELQTNWLPMPDGACRIVLRNYEPLPELLEGRFRYPAIERIV